MNLILLGFWNVNISGSISNLKQKMPVDFLDIYRTTVPFLFID
jgi:hypothetical protein